MPVPVKSILTAFNEVEKQFRQFLDYVPFVPEHDQVWSPVLASCIMEACSQLDSFWKAASSSQSPGNANIKDHFVGFGNRVGSRWLILWGDEGRELMPFKEWNTALPFTKAEFAPLPWWQAYNEIKHDRWANIRQATIVNAANAIAGLFLAIVRTDECVDTLVELGWIRSSYSLPYAIDRMIAANEIPDAGVTIESALFSYASASAHPEFQRYIISYHGCSHRFGRWLENKYKRGIVF